MYSLHVPSVQVGSKTSILGNKILWPYDSPHVVVRFKTKENPIWSKALTMPLTIWNYV